MSLQKLEILRTLWHTQRAILEGVTYDELGVPCAISGIGRDEALTGGDSGEPVYRTYVLSLQVWDGYQGWAQDDTKPRAIRVVFSADEMRELAATWHMASDKKLDDNMRGVLGAL